MPFISFSCIWAVSARARSFLKMVKKKKKKSRILNKTATKRRDDISKWRLKNGTKQKESKKQKNTGEKESIRMSKR